MTFGLKHDIKLVISLVRDLDQTLISNCLNLNQALGLFLVSHDGSEIFNLFIQQELFRVQTNDSHAQGLNFRIIRLGVSLNITVQIS